MDTTETYIRMSDHDDVCALAGLLSLESKQGSVFVKADDHNVIVWAADMIVAPPAIKFIRLFRQDQLQEMVDTLQPINRLCEFSIFCFEYDRDHFTLQFSPRKYAQLFKSMEQLWLAFAMETLHSKVWDGNTWV